MPRRIFIDRTANRKPYPNTAAPRGRPSPKAQATQI